MKYNIELATEMFPWKKIEKEKILDIRIEKITETTTK